jgi:hypothetical protein
MHSSSNPNQSHPHSVQWTQSNSANAMPDAKVEQVIIDSDQHLDTLLENPEPIVLTDHVLYAAMNALQQANPELSFKAFCREWFPSHAIQDVQSSLSEVLQSRLNNSSPHIQTGFAWLAIGIAVMSLPLSSNQHLLIYISSYVAIIFGTMKMIHGSMTKRRLLRMLQVLNQIEVIVVHTSKSLEAIN